jgi:hypothetical protein
MTRPGSDDELDAFEQRLAARMQRQADHGVRPFDAAEIARAAATQHNRGGFGGSWLPRLSWLAGAAALAVVAFGGGILAANAGLFGTASVGAPPSLVASLPSSQPSIPVATVAPTRSEAPTLPPTAAPITACSSQALSAQVTAWSGAAGSRVASVTLTNTGSVTCRLRTMDRPELVAGASGSHVLIEGAASSGTATLLLDAGASVRTQAEASNYCGADPVAPVSVAFVLGGGERVVAAPRSASDTFGVPPCLGSLAPATMTMHPWAP